MTSKAIITNLNKIERIRITCNHCGTTIEQRITETSLPMWSCIKCHKELTKQIVQVFYRIKEELQTLHNLDKLEFNDVDIELIVRTDD